MKEKIKIDLGSVQKTLFMPVWARAVETGKTNPLLVDNTAVTILESVDFDFATMTQNVPEISQVSWVARCKRFDMVIKEFIAKHPGGTIVNIGCGLDTTYERIDNQNVIWYDLDLPDVIELRKKFLCETANRKFIAGSFLDTKWFDIISRPKEILFISAGVFVYFDEEEIKEFLLKLVNSFPGAGLFFDVTSPKGVEIANIVIQKSGLDEKSFFKWGLKDKNDITSWSSKIKLLGTFYTYQIEGIRLSEKDMQMAAMSDSLDIQYMVHLKLS
ncbi:MAG: class I SAM-dependent methyltransferase [Ignavibacteriales bacterium]|nr:MAG: class I SAM-dependent methyltransferase [Ignavibacteriales bacterium]